MVPIAGQYKSLARRRGSMIGGASDLKAVEAGDDGERAVGVLGVDQTLASLTIASDSSCRGSEIREFHSLPLPFCAVLRNTDLGFQMAGYLSRESRAGEITLPRCLLVGGKLQDIRALVPVAMSPLHHPDDSILLIIANKANMTGTFLSAENPLLKETCFMKNSPDDDVRMKLATVKAV